MTNPDFAGLSEALDELVAIAGKNVYIALVKPAGYDDWVVHVGYDNHSNYSPTQTVRQEIERVKRRENGGPANAARAR